MRTSLLMAIVSTAFANSVLATEEQKPQKCGTEIECVVIHARLREETPIEAPLSETYFSQDKINAAGIERVADFIQLSPNVSISNSQGIGTSFITIRGMTQVRNGESPVAVVIDDVLQVNARQFRQQMQDIDSIEVVRGPQGALYGRNATGGAIIIRSKKPTKQTSGFVRLSLAEGDKQTLQAGLDGAASQNTLYRVALHDSHQDGQINNAFLNRTVDYFDETELKGSLYYSLDKKTTITARGKYSTIEGGGLNFTFQPAVYGPDGLTLAQNSFPFDFSQSDANNTDQNISANNLGFNERKMTDLSLKMDYRGDDFTLLAITGYNRLEEFTAGDQFPYTAATTTETVIGPVDGSQTQFVDLGAWSQELRLSAQQEHLQWMVGAYYLDTDRFISSTTGDDRGLGIVRIEQQPDFTHPDNPTLLFFADDNENRAWAIYGNADYDISDEWQISAALRYDRDQRKQKVSEYNFGVNPGAVNKKTFDQWQPKFSVRYLLNDDMSTYLTWGKGFRSGQFNQNGVADAAAQAGLAGVSDIAQQEISRSTEVGFKAYFKTLDLSLTTSLFKTDVSGQHYFVFVGALGAQVLTNIDEVQLQGGELELYKPISDSLSASLGYGYTNSKINKFTLDNTTEGNRAPYVPQSSLNLGLQYQSELGNALELTVRADYEYRGRQYWSPQNITPRNSLELTNLRITLQSQDDHWSLVASISNAFNEQYNSEYVSGGFAHPAVGSLWQLDLKYQF
jgi:iron complex outermembrane receptor protein